MPAPSLSTDETDIETIVPISSPYNNFIPRYFQFAPRNLPVALRYSSAPKMIYDVNSHLFRSFLAVSGGAGGGAAK